MSSPRPAAQARDVLTRWHVTVPGLATAWLVLLAFVAMLASRERKLRRELERLRAMIDDRTTEAH